MQRVVKTPQLVLCLVVTVKQGWDGYFNTSADQTVSSGRWDTEVRDDWKRKHGLVDHTDTELTRRSQRSVKSIGNSPKFSSIAFVHIQLRDVCREFITCCIFDSSEITKPGLSLLL